MDKNTIYTKLHEELGRKYQLDPWHVKGIRVKTLCDRKHRSEVLLDYVKKLDRKTFKKNKPKEYYLQIIAFIKTATDEQWSDITKQIR